MLLLAAAALAALGGGRAQAQWGYGWGGGFWGVMNAGGGQANAATLSYINQRTSQAAAHAYATRGSIGGGNVYAGNPNAYFNHIRDNTTGSFFDRFDIASRRVPGAQPPPASVVAAAYGPAPAGPVGEIPPPPDPSGRDRTQGQGRANPPQPHPAVAPLASFFSAAGKLVWPSVAPAEGDLGAKQASATASAEAVRAQEKANGSASVGLVTEARARLLAYGRPALAYVRQNATPALADGFNSFLLGLYDALGAAAR
jgi:hypothetical protein